MKISVFYANVLDAAEKSGLAVEEVLEKIKNAGISALDFDFEQIRNGLPDAVISSGFGVSSIYAFSDYSPDEAFDKAAEAVDLAAKHGAVVMFVPEKLPESIICELKARKSREDIFDWLDKNGTSRKTAETIEKLSVLAESKGVEAAVENFDSHRSLTERMYEIEWLMINAPHLKFNLDTGNSITCGEDIKELYRLFGGRIANVHCKDRLSDNRTTAVGTGEMPIAEIKNSLLKTGYPGNFSIEVFGVPNPLSAIILSAENLIK